MSLYDLLKSLEHGGDLTPTMETDDQGQFCTGLTANQHARTAIAVWYIKNTATGYEILTDPMAENAELIADYMENTDIGRFERIGHVVAALAEKQAMEAVERESAWESAWEKLIQDITERERS